MALVLQGRGALGANEPRADLLNGDLEKIRLEFDAHVVGTLSVVRAFVPKITAHGGGDRSHLCPAPINE